MYKNFIRSLVTVGFLAMFSLAQAQVGNVTGDLGTTCQSTGTIMTASGACTFTPTAYKISIFEMGLCTANPFGAAQTGTTFDRTSCVTTYADAAPVTVDVAASLGGAPISLTGTSTPPAENTYTHAYMMMGDTFTVSGSFVNGANTFVSRADGSATTGIGNIQEAANNLTNFGDGTNCDSGFLNVPVSSGTMSAFITNAALVRSVRTGGAAGNPSVCANSGRLTGVMTLTTPVVVTSDTLQVVFNFDLTNQGVQFFDDAGNDSVPDAFGSGPFSGSFTVINN
tara:strand:+ start:18 stop:863 length:846 start_codon:yes stop_codon:yes gene_type:complete